MTPRDITEADMEHWADLNPRRFSFTGPGEIEADILACPGLITDGDNLAGLIVRVPWTLDEIELAHLARGGTIWLSTWGGLPVHSLEVQEPGLSHPSETRSEL